MPKTFPFKSKGFNPFGELVGLNFSKSEGGFSQCALEVKESLLNPHQVLHGGVLYTMADTGMGAALYTCLNEDDLCATVEVKIVYFSAVTSGVLTCNTTVINKGKRIATMESEIMNEGRPVAKAIGTFTIFKSREA